MKILVLGAGIAGCSIVHQLMAGNQGLEVLLIEQRTGPAQETSGHRLAMAHPQIAMKKTKLQQFTQLGNRLAFQERLRLRGHRCWFECPEQRWLRKTCPHPNAID